MTTKNKKTLIVLLTFMGYSIGAIGVYLKLKGYNEANIFLIVAILLIGFKWVLANVSSKSKQK